LIAALVQYANMTSQCVKVFAIQDIIENKRANFTGQSMTTSGHKILWYDRLRARDHVELKIDELRCSASTPLNSILS